MQCLLVVQSPILSLLQLLQKYCCSSCQVETTSKKNMVCFGIKEHKEQFMNFLITDELISIPQKTLDYEVDNDQLLYNRLGDTILVIQDVTISS